MVNRVEGRGHVLRYANSCRATSRSSSLDETGRLEIGLSQNQVRLILLRVMRLFKHYFHFVCCCQGLNFKASKHCELQIILGISHN